MNELKALVIGKLALGCKNILWSLEAEPTAYKRFEYPEPPHFLQSINPTTIPAMGLTNKSKEAQSNRFKHYFKNEIIKQDTQKMVKVPWRALY